MNPKDSPKKLTKWIIWAFERHVGEWRYVTRSAETALEAAEGWVANRTPYEVDASIDRSGAAFPELAASPTPVQAIPFNQAVRITGAFASWP